MRVTTLPFPGLLMILLGSLPLVAEAGDWREIHFSNDVVPIFSRYGCNSSGCHGKAEGQNGFRLSVFGFDPAADYVSLTQESRGRRVFQPIPEKSLLLLKISGGMPHGGGVRIKRESEEFSVLRDWIVQGMPVGKPDAPHVVSIQTRPSERVMAFRTRQKLQVMAIYSDGREVDVTKHCRFQSNRESIATVDEFGEVTAQDVAGDVAVMAAYRESNAVFTALVPREEASDNGPFPPPLTRLDQLVDDKLNKLHIVPAPLCDDATYLRRVYLDVIGRLPTPAECRDFLSDTRNDKRRQVLNRLFERPDYADYWALKWSDWLRVDRQALGHKGAYSYYRWIRESFARNKAMDQFARELVEADGLVADNPATQFYKVAKDPGDAAAMLSQAMLGIRIDCAKCHHHPFDRWSQDDYFGMQAFFVPLTFKQTLRGEFLLAAKNELTRHPRTGESVFAHALGTQMPKANPDGDRRKILAEWLVSPDNPFFARNIANRMWAHFLGRGIIEPVDDVRSTNPPTNPELLDALANHLITSQFDLRQLVIAIVASRTYQASSTVNSTNETDEQNYSRALLRRLEAEVLLDAICDATGVPEKFDGAPAGFRAVQLWDSQVTNYFLTTTGRPTRSTVCDCERVGAPSVAQVLHSLNSPHLESKLNHDRGRIAQLIRAFPDDDRRVIEEMYLAFFSRPPSDAEEMSARNHIEKSGPSNRKTALEDLGWSMLNSLEFLFNH